MKPTNEQQEIINAAVAGKNLAIQAAAGCGKSSSLKLIAEALPKKNILYLVFNKDNADEAAKVFPANVECRTINSLAYRAIVKFPKSAFGKRLNGLTFSEIPFAKGVPEALEGAYKLCVRNTITAFCNSWHRNLADFFANFDWTMIFEFLEVGEDCKEEFKEEFKDIVLSYWIELSSENSDKSISHDVYLKLYQLSEPLLVQYDLIMVDEFQDFNPVNLAILQNQTHCQIIVVGDPHQSIYGFRGAVNGFDYIPKSYTRLMLTESFRFTAEIAAIARKILKMKGADFPLVGLAEPREVTENSSKAILCRTNLQIILYILTAIKENRKVYTNVDLNGVKSNLYHVEAVMYGKEPRFPARDLLHIKNNNDLYKFKEIDNDIRMLHDIVVTIKPIGGVYGFLEKAKEVLTTKDKADYVLISGHRSKGMEFDTVDLSNDFGPKTDKKGNILTKEWVEKLLNDPQEINLLYIAVTRGKFKVGIERDVLGVIESWDWWRKQVA